MWIKLEKNWYNIYILGMFTNFVSFSLGFVSQATKHQSVQPILFYSFPIMFTLLLSAKQHQIILPIMLQNFLIRSETKLVCNKIGLMIYYSKQKYKRLKRNINCFIKSELFLISVFHWRVTSISNLFWTSDHKLNTFLPQ